MTNKTLTSAIVLICFNQQEYIYDALEGIRTQTIEADEVVIADDCSKDNTREIIKRYVAEYNLQDKWRVLLNETNLGINRNLQNAIDNTVSDIIIPMSGDDISLPNRCEVVLSLFSEYPDMHIVSTSIFKIDESNKTIGELSYDNKLVSDVKKVIVAGMPNVFPVGQSWRRSVFSKFGKLPSDLPNEDDQITFRGILDNGIYCSSIKTVKYRVHSTSASSWLRNNQSDQEYFNRFLEDMLVRKAHMEYWLQTLLQVQRPDRNDLISLVKLKVEIYSFFNKLNSKSSSQRLAFLIKHQKGLGLRESYYLFFGKFGVLTWRKLKRVLGR